MSPVAILALALLAQEAPAPLPATETLIHEVQARQKHMDEVRENYTFHQTLVTEDLDSKGHVKKTESQELELFFVNGHRVDRMVKKNGRDLTPSENRSEDERVQKEARKYSKAPQAEGPEVIAMSRVLEIVDVSAPRRTVLNGRGTLVFDFTGDPDSKAHGLAQKAAKKVTGTVWVDEEDRSVARLDARFLDNFKIGAGLLATIQKGSSAHFEQTRVADKVWLPSITEIHLAARELVFASVRQSIHVKDFDYRRFDTNATEHVGTPAQ